MQALPRAVLFDHESLIEGDCLILCIFLCTLGLNFRINILRMIRSDCLCQGET